MKVVILFLSQEIDDPNVDSEFIAGYESSGLTWEGELTKVENVYSFLFTDELLQEYYNNGYEMLLRNAAPQFGDLDIYENARNAGMLFVSPSGSNAYVTANAFNTREILVRCGSGIPEYGNQTSYPPMFYDKNDSEGSGFAVADVRQCGQTYTLSHIRRVSSGILAFKIAGYTGDYGDIGLHLSGTPVYFSGLTGSDISPLPTGLKYCNNVGNGANESNEFFMVEHTTTAGTIDTGFLTSDYQELSAGTMQFGDTNTGRALIRITGATVFPSIPSAVTITGISGFTNNVPDGVMPIYAIVNGRGYYNMIKVTHSLGSGVYAGGGRVYNVSQSYSHAYIGGKLAAIKDITGEDWSTVLGKAIVTASNGSLRDTHNGYGVINVELATAVGDYIVTLETPVLNEIIETFVGNFPLTWNLIPFADTYEIYLRGELYATVKAQITTYTVTNFQRQNKSKKNLFQVRAVNGDQYSEFSNSQEYPYYYYTGVLTNESLEIDGYGFNYGGNYGN